MRHNLDGLLRYVREICEGMNYDGRPATKQDMDFLANDDKLLRMNQLLSELASGARYYYLDVVTIGKSKYSEPKEKISEIKNLIISNNSHLEKIVENSNNSAEFEKILDRELIKIIERFARALCRIFTLGELGKGRRKVYSNITIFLNLMDIMDRDLGKAEYCKNRFLN